MVALSGVAVAEQAPVAPDGDPPFRITREVIAGGGISRARSACFDLAATIAEPVTGTAGNAMFSLTAGFWSDPASTDSIFRSSFESCQP